jgi:outer membrane protein OmpA-like peptidoglycan-associated protein
VAILSGVVAAYVTITRKGGVIAGVAIATALMPPLAVTGYGLATSSAAIAGGAFLLFMTNVVAILGCVFVMARLFGFKPEQKIRARWQELGLAATILIFALPLGFSLRDIAVEARQTHRARSAIERMFTDGKPRVDDLRISVEDGALKSVKAVVVTSTFVPDLGGKVSAALDGKPEVDIQQILTAQGKREAETAGGALGNRALAESTAAPTPEQHLRTLLGDVATVEGIRHEGSNLTAIVRLNGKADLADYLALEAAADRLSPSVDVHLVPPLTSLSAIPFVEGRSTLDAAAERNIRTATWALARWGVAEVTVEGYASPSRRGPNAADRRVAMARGQAVANMLTAQGIRVAEVTAIVPNDPQAAALNPWRAEIRPLGDVQPTLAVPAQR